MYAETEGKSLMPKLEGHAAKERAAQRILDGLERAAERGEEIAKLLAERTNSITSPATRDGQTKDDKNPIAVLPPLFGRIEELTQAINQSFYDIKDNIDRMEL